MSSEVAKKANILYYLRDWPHRLSARTHPSQGWKRGSIPRGVTKHTKACTAAGLCAYVTAAGISHQ